MLAQRVASAVVGLPIIVGLVVMGGGVYTATVALILLLATLEFEAPLLGWRHPLALLAASLSAALAAGAFVGPDWLLWFGTGLVILPLVFVALAGDPKTGLLHWLWTAGGVLYVGWLGSHLVLLREAPDGRDWVFLVLFATFATDTSSYFVGHVLGRRRLAPRVSPGKTLEGAIGGILFGLAAALLLNYFLGLRKEALLILPVAVLLPLAAEVGDLAESVLKRGMQIKDASALIPGHGGLMDRLDSILFTSVVLYYYLLWILP
jgi:phosphatidate cytidylyltransferase